MNQALRGRTALITGGSQGLGLEIARTYVRSGAGVCICGRDPETLAIAVSELESLARDGQRLFSHVADVSRRIEVDALVAEVIAHFPQLTILVNNAGVYGPKGPVELADWEEWVSAIQVNLLGSVLPARALIGHFKRQGYGKVVQLSGGGATAPLPGLSAYAASKAAAVRFAETLAEELRAYNVDVNSVAPGALNTRLLDEVLAAGPDRVGQAFYERAVEQQRSGGTPLERGAELATFLASATSDGITGKLLSAVWDPWSELPGRLSDLESDVYTLRRIVPRDRSLSWG